VPGVRMAEKDEAKPAKPARGRSRKKAANE